MTDHHMSDDQLRQLHRQLLAEVKPPPIPAELHVDAFLEGIYERAAAAQASALEPILDAAMTPLQAPGDACWREVDEPAGIRDQVEIALPDGAAPGWLWARVRADMQVQRAALVATKRKASRSLVMRYAAAAAVVIAATVGAFFLVEQGTNEQPTFVWVTDSSLDGASDLLMGRR